MRVKNILGAGAMALLLAGWGSSPVSAAAVDVPESLSGLGSVDVWEVKCTGPASLLNAHVRDTNAGDDLFIITTLALTPGSIKGAADTERNVLPTTNFSPAASVVRPVGSLGGIKAYVTVSLISSSGNAGYELRISCGNTPNTPTAKLLQDQ